MARTTTLLAIGFAAVPYLLLSAQEARKPTPAQSQQAAKAMGQLKARCSSCHNSDRPTAKLDLSTPAGIANGGISGKLFEAGKGKDSLLVQRLRGHGGKPQMPLGFAPLLEEDIQTIIDWIDAGGHTDVVAPHWAYQKPLRPKLPTVKQKAWVKNPIDAFILARLEREGIKPSPAASRETLIRRVSLDLIGLPPTVEEVDAFLADQRPDAYERLVDRLLASPHYGERQARIWLDLARYADTDGYEKDLRRTAWKWRDWVIQAYNKNLPFDQFTIEQIAGDQLPEPTIDQLVATGFHRNTMLNLEGGVDQEEAHFNVVLDRVGTTSTVWLGSSMACARCHDHKYDPFSQKDFYRIAAFFSNAAILPRGPKEVGEEKWYETSIPVPSPQQIALQTKLEKDLREADRAMNRWTPELVEAFDRWTEFMGEGNPWVGLEDTAKSQSGVTFAEDEFGFYLAKGNRPDKDTYTVSVDRFQPDTKYGFKIDVEPDDALPGKGPGRSDNGNFVISGVKVLLNGKSVALKGAVADFSQNGFDANGLVTGKSGGWAVVPQTGKPHSIAFQFKEPLKLKYEDKLDFVIEQQSNYAGHTLGKFRVGLTRLPDPLSYIVPANLKEALARRNSADIETLKKYFVTVTSLLEKERAHRTKIAMDLNRLKAEIPTALIMRDKPSKGPLTAYFRDRGEFLSKGEALYAGTPSFLPQLPQKARVNRLDLAKWLVDENNPLTARVQVNRFWEQYFGKGIVETTEDLGTQSAERSHPELLDWLATEFMRLKWDMKAMHRMIVTSNAYRQASNATPDLLRRDPENRLIARGPRFRMEAEMIRDTALRASGLFNPKVGGPSVFPYQPEGVWDSAFISEKWVESKNGDNHRRGIYTFWKRTMPYANFMAFDTASREECSPRRIRTNTPLQALAQLNDLSTFEAAKELGKSMSKRGIAYGFRACTSRRPSKAEVDRLERLRVQMLVRYRKSPEMAKKIGGSPEEAAWAMVGNVLLNLDETITKG